MLYDLDKTIREMKNLGETLVPYSFPKVSNQDEDQISLLKTRDVVVDGYPVVVHYNQCRNGDRTQETFQCLGVKAPFLPFTLVIKLAVRFLGKSDLFFVNPVINNKRVYVFTIHRDRDGNMVQPTHKVVREITYDDVTIQVIDPAHVNFF